MFNLYVDINYYDKHLLINTFKHKQIKQPNSHHHKHHKHIHSCLTYKCVHLNKTNTFNKSSQLRYSFQPSINTNAGRLAKKHDDKQHRLYVQYLSTYSNTLNSYHKYSRCIKSSEYFKEHNDILHQHHHNTKLSYNSIHNYTFNNYLKNLH